jgi:hypothetical protein
MQWGRFGSITKKQEINTIRDCSSSGWQPTAGKLSTNRVWAVGVSVVGLTKAVCQEYQLIHHCEVTYDCVVCWCLGSWLMWELWFLNPWKKTLAFCSFGNIMILCSFGNFIYFWYPSLLNFRTFRISLSFSTVFFGERLELTCRLEGESFD